MTREVLCAYLQSQPLAVVSSIDAAGAPQSAVVGIAVSEDMEIIFDTVEACSLKAANAPRPGRDWYISSLLPIGPVTAISMTQKILFMNGTGNSIFILPVPSVNCDIPVIK